MTKKKNRRNNEKYPALDKKFTLKTRQELVDYDYIDKLSEAEKDWLNRFTEEYTNAKFNHDGKKIQKSKKYTKDSYDRNNSRNRDILTRVKASGKLKDTETIQENDISVMSPEENLILKETIKEKLNLVKKRKNSGDGEK